MIERHHIVYRSQGGLDYELNYKYLESEAHRGNNGPHKCRETDLKYKKELQEKLEKILNKKFYTTEELVKILDLDKRQAKRAFRKLDYHPDRGIKRKDVIKRLMGGRFYL
ncbi:HNH endonuclease [Clostridium sp. Cult2]|uniref:HNH endonuclease n=1 Tax=Clostridium sp. Cult2 TaxID=2079003 RepID=UPI001F2E462E|nr:HNH endonuclease [Clostridium sp. Cult2]MCF6466366.1 HNH endonuclease [Clostridium sp. Cult2]